MYEDALQQRGLLERARELGLESVVQYIHSTEWDFDVEHLELGNREGAEDKLLEIHLSEVGQIQPVLILEINSNRLVVDGGKRVACARKLGRRTIRGVVIVGVTE